MALFLSLTPAQADSVLFSDDFDALNSAANWRTNKSATDSAADFAFDYSTLGIPSAPRSANGSTIGTRFLANQSAGVQQGVSASPIGKSFTSNFKMQFDAWLNYNGPLPAGGNGSTQMASFGWGTNGTTAQWAGSSNGIMFAASSDGGTAQDYRVYRNNGLLDPTVAANAGVYAAGNTATARDNLNAYYSTFGGKSAPAAQLALFPQQSGTTPAGTFGMAWRDVVIERIGNSLTWTVDGKLIATANLSGATLAGSNIFLGQFDINATSSTDPNDFLLTAIYDNLVVTGNTSPVLVGGPFSFNFTQGTSISGAGITATDVDGDTLTYTLSGGALPDGVTFNSADGTFSGTPTGSSGPIVRTVTVTDGKGGIASAQVTLSVVGTSGAIISEFRFHGAAGATDEYVEVYNTLGTPLNISGWKIQTNTAAGVKEALVPQNTTVPARGHFLFTGAGYSLGTYGASNASIADDILDDSGVALLNAGGTVQDAVGFIPSASTLKEGTGLTSAPNVDGEYAFMRDFTNSLPKDSGDSTADFVFVSTGASANFDQTAGSFGTPVTVAGTNGAVAAQLGAPSPEGLASPVYVNDQVTNNLLEPGVSQGAAPNRVRTGSGNGGTLIVRRTLKNNTNRALTRVRFMVTRITADGSALTAGQTRTSQAIIRLTDSPDEPSVLLSDGVTSVAVSGTTFEANATGLPTEPLGGGLGSSVSFNAVLSTPLAPSGTAGDTRAYSFTFNIVKSGNFTAILNIEALPAP